MGKRKGMDYAILAITILLVLFGLVMVFSASYYLSLSSGSEGSKFLLKQLLGAGIGLGALWLTSLVPYRAWRTPTIPLGIVAVSVVLLVAVLFMPDKNNVNRFITVGPIQFQPSELGRVALIFFIAWWVSNHGEDLRSRDFKKFRRGIGAPLLVLGLIAGLVLMGKNLSMAFSTVLIGLAMLLVAGINWRPFLVLLGSGTALGVLFTVTVSYRMKRLLIFTNPWKDPRGDGYQLIQSLYALGNGGLFGVGLGNSRQKLLWLPYAESDFILCIIGEEFGFLGMALLVAAFWVLVWRGMLVAVRAPDEFGMLMAAGITSLIGIQFLINILVVTSSMPPTGVPLPFISNGNTSLVVFMAVVGMLLNVSKHSVKT